MSCRRVLLVGDPASAESTIAAAALKEAVPGCELRHVADPAEVRHLVADGNWHPELVVACQSWSDQFSETDVIGLMSLVPLARIICAYGAWCVSDGRTRNVWPLAMRVPVEYVGLRIRRELATLDDRSTTDPLPWTASRSEVFSADFCELPLATLGALRIALDSPDRAFAQMLRAALLRGGARLDTPGNHFEPTHIVWDADPWCCDRAMALGALRRLKPAARIVACLGFPDSALVADIRDAGADATWFKLAPLAALWALLDPSDRAAAR